MARGPIEVPIGIDTGAFEKGIKTGFIKPTEDAEKALKDLNKAADSGELERELKAGEKATGRLKDEIKRTADAVERDFRQSFKRAGAAANSGMDRAGDVTGEFKDEAMANFSEVTSSFSGNMSSAVDGVQGTLGGLASGIGGPLGLALGGAAVAVGAIGQGFADAAEEAQALREQAVGLADAALDAGQGISEYITGAEQVAERIKALNAEGGEGFEWFWEDDPSKLEEWNKALAATGGSFADIQTILSAGDGDLENYTKDVEEARDAARKEADALDVKAAALADTGKLLTDAEQKTREYSRAQDQAYTTQADYLRNEVNLREEAAEADQAYTNSGINSARARIEAAEQEADARVAVKDSVLGAYDSMRDAATNYATNEAGALDINRWLDYMNQHAAAVAQYQANIEAIRISPEQWANLLEMPEDQRMQWVAQFAALPEDARAPFAAALNDVGSSSGSGAAVAFEESFNPSADVDVQIEADTTKPEADLNELARDRTATLIVKVKDDASQAVNDLVRQLESRVIRIPVEVDTTAYDAWVPRVKYGRVIPTRADGSRWD